MDDDEQAVWVPCVFVQSSVLQEVILLLCKLRDYKQLSYWTRCLLMVCWTTGGLCEDLQICWLWRCIVQLYLLQLRWLWPIYAGLNSPAVWFLHIPLFLNLSNIHKTKEQNSAIWPTKSALPFDHGWSILPSPPHSHAFPPTGPLMPLLIKNLWISSLKMPDDLASTVVCGNEFHWFITL